MWNAMSQERYLLRCLPVSASKCPALHLSNAWTPGSGNTGDGSTGQLSALLPWRATVANPRGRGKSKP